MHILRLPIVGKRVRHKNAGLLPRFASVIRSRSGILSPLQLPWHKDGPQ